MPDSPRLRMIEEQLRADPDDEFLRYARAMECSSLGDDAAAVAHLRALIALNPAAPYIPAFLMCGQALLRLDDEAGAAAVLKQGIAAASKVNTADAAHARSEMEGLLASVE